MGSARLRNPLEYPPSLAWAVRLGLATGLADRTLTWAVTKSYLPVSRLWAAAELAKGEIDRFREALAPFSVPQHLPRSLPRRLRHVGTLAAAAADAQQQWEETLFASHSSVEQLVSAEVQRRQHSDLFMIEGRQVLLPMLLRGMRPPLPDGTPSEAEIETLLGAHLAEPLRYYRAPDPMPPILRSQTVPSELGQEYWLCFQGRDGSKSWAHVFEPSQSRNIPTIIHGHGLYMETEMVAHGEDSVVALVQRGIRVVRLDLPFHDRRRRRGTYGGQPIMSAIPLGPIEFFAAYAYDIAVLMDWARAQGTGPVAVGGISLGALASQLVMGAARYWPSALRPDYAYLVTVTDQFLDALDRSSLVRMAGVHALLKRHGWNPEKLSRWNGFFEPPHDPGIPASRIVLVLGEQDQVTPIQGGLRLAKKWKLPESNVIMHPGGHFSVPLGVFARRDPYGEIARRLFQL